MPELPSPDIADACYHSGMALYAEKNFREAASRFEQAARLRPEFVDAWYNLGLTCKKLAAHEKAEAAFEKTLSLRPDHHAARFHLGSLLMLAGKYENALSHFSTLLEHWPEHPETLVNLATCHLKLHQLETALRYYERALTLLPEDTQVLFNLGVIHAQSGDTDLAIQYYQRALRSDPDFFDAHYNMALLFLARQHPAFAMECLQEAKRLQPSNTSVNYLIHSLKNNPHLKAAPIEHITALFDGYAEHYEPHLLMALEYTIPELFFQRVQKIRPPLSNIDILDIGCGTGLCGLRFRGLAHTLHGVDLSEKMLERAQEKNGYDQLYQADIHAWLETCTSSYDLILAGDVLVYLGCLDTLFQQVQKVLRHRGFFVFNTEITENADYQILPSGRFAHSREYLATLAKRYGLKLAGCDIIVSRKQHNDPVQGYLCVLERKS